MEFSSDKWHLFLYTKVNLSIVLLQEKQLAIEKKGADVCIFAFPKQKSPEKLINYHPRNLKRVNKRCCMATMKDINSMAFSLQCFHEIMKFHFFNNKLFPKWTVPEIDTKTLCYFSQPHWQISDPKWRLMTQDLKPWRNSIWDGIG